ncbi:hypothetical protein AVEN_68216-1 [Araneus ventricosus]|uniref:Uncharacterized protein n=1 Tax=Araneus ventricosus TaxID=182803 RepID=A0A4Y2PE32_ARAVE|nr:hypothetical protein AVEN_68216-1 [Araneus ventricosus]
MPPLFAPLHVTPQHVNSISSSNLHINTIFYFVLRLLVTPTHISPPPQTVDFRFYFLHDLPLKRGANLVKSFDVPPSLVRGLKRESAHEALEFVSFGILAFPSRYAVFHQFLKLTIAFSFPCSKISSLGTM